MNRRHEYAVERPAPFRLADLEVPMPEPLRKEDSEAQRHENERKRRLKAGAPRCETVGEWMRDRQCDGVESGVAREEFRRGSSF